MRLRRIVLIMALGSSAAAAAIACKGFGGEDEPLVDGGAEAAAVDSPDSSDGGAAARDAADGASWECEGGLVVWDMASVNPPSPLMEFDKNSGVTLTPMSDEAGAFGRFIQTFAPLDGGSIYRVNLSVTVATTDVCMSMRIRHVAFGPAAAAVDEMAATVFAPDASYGFAQLVQVKTIIEATSGFGDSTPGNTLSFEDASVLSGDATKWITWRFEGHRETAGFRFQLFENGHLVMSSDPFPPGVVPYGGAFGLGPHSEYTVNGASPGIIDFANVRVDRLPN